MFGVHRLKWADQQNPATFGSAELEPCQRMHPQFKGERGEIPVWAQIVRKKEAEKEELRQALIERRLLTASSQQAK